MVVRLCARADGRVLGHRVHPSGRDWPPAATYSAARRSTFSSGMRLELLEGTRSSYSYST